MDRPPPPERSPPPRIGGSQRIGGFRGRSSPPKQGEFSIKVPYVLASHRPICYNYLILKYLREAKIMRANIFKMCPAMLAFSIPIAALVFSPCPPAFAGSILGWGWNRFGQVNSHFF